MNHNHLLGPECKKLLEMAEALKLVDDPAENSLITKVLMKKDEKIAGKLVKKYEHQYYRQITRPNHFITKENNLSGEFRFGETNDEVEFGLDRLELNRHAFLSGASGSGKTNSNLNLLLQCHEKRGFHTVYYDIKADGACLARENILVIPQKLYRVNPLALPHPLADLDSHINIMARVLSEEMQFMQRGSSVVLFSLQSIYQLYEVEKQLAKYDFNSVEFPNLFQLYDLIISYEFSKRVRGQGKESLFSYSEKLERYLIELGDIVKCSHGFNKLKLLADKDVMVVELSGLSEEIQNLVIISDLILYNTILRYTGVRNELQFLAVIDEAKGLVGEHNKNKFILKFLVSTIRESGIGLWLCDQVPSEISQFFLSNINNLFVFRHSDGTDLRKIQNSLGASYKQILENYNLQPGQAIVRTSKAKDLLRINTPKIEINKNISDQELLEITQEPLKELYKDVKVSTQKQKKLPSTLDVDEKLLLNQIINDPTKPSTHHYTQLVWNNNKGHAVKERLIKKGYLSQTKSNVGKGGRSAQLLKPTKKALDEFKIKNTEGRGHTLHKQYQHQFKQIAEQLGCKAVIEECLDNNPEGPDLGITTQDNKKIATEVCITSKSQTERDNISKNLKIGYNRVILTFIDKEVLEKTKQLSYSAYSEETLRLVRLCLVQDFESVLQEAISD